jgi:four helix bundle protein
MKVYQNIKVWEKSHKLTLAVYAATASFPSQERYGLTSQLRRSAASTPANIAEGCGRNGAAELARFMDMSMGSANELEYHLLLARDLSYLDEAAWSDLTERTIQIKRMLASFLKTLRAAA